MSGRHIETETQRVVGDGNVDTWEEIDALPVTQRQRNKNLSPGNIAFSFWDQIIDQVTESGKRSLTGFLGAIETPDIEELERRSGMSAGEIVAAAARHG